jgi:hypothetical protein
VDALNKVLRESEKQTTGGTTHPLGDVLSCKLSQSAQLSLEQRKKKWGKSWNPLGRCAAHRMVSQLQRDLRSYFRFTNTAMLLLFEPLRHAVEVELVKAIRQGCNFFPIDELV